nr:unnamed protein product [Spirometra erinaceieuropaei]
MIRQHHDGMMARLTDDGTISGAFAVTNGMKRGYVLAPALFGLMFSVMLVDAYRDERPGIRISHRAGRPLLNSRRMQGPTRLSTITVHDLLLEDDREFHTTTEVSMRQSMDLLIAGPRDNDYPVIDDHTFAAPLPSIADICLPQPLRRPQRSAS